MDDTLRERVDALERAVTDGDCELTALAEDAEAIQRLEALESQLEDLDDRVAELEAATQALRGYVGNIRSVNRDVEQRADTALAKAQAVEATLDGEFSAGETNAPDEPAPGPATSADGGLSHQPHSQHRSETCHACGRPHDESATRGGASQRAEPIDGDSRTEPDSRGTFQPVTETDDETIPEQTEETGTLQRVREML